jgi:hypothetical protein
MEVGQLCRVEGGAGGGGGGADGDPEGAPAAPLVVLRLRIDLFSVVGFGNQSGGWGRRQGLRAVWGGGAVRWGCARCSLGKVQVGCVERDCAASSSISEGGEPKNPL